MATTPVNNKTRTLEMRARENNGAALVKKAERLINKKVREKSWLEKKDDEISSRLLWNCYIQKANENNIRVPGWERKEMAIAKRFAGKVGGMDRAINIIGYIFDNWSELSKKWKMEENSSPTINIISTFGLSLVNIISKQEETKGLRIGLGTKAIVSYTGGKDERGRDSESRQLHLPE